MLLVNKYLQLDYILAKFGGVGQKVTEVRALDWADLPQSWLRKFSTKKRLTTWMPWVNYP